MSRLTIEPKANVFIGNVNARIRDKLWQKVVEKWDVPAVMIYTTNVEQGYKIRIHKDPTRDVYESNGIYLPFLREKEKTKEE